MSLHISNLFLDALRQEIVDYPTAYFRIGPRRSGPVLPPSAALTWFLGEQGEPDTNVVVRVNQTLWWLDTTCSNRRHVVEVHWASDMFRYSTSRFGAQRDDQTASLALTSVCLALAQLFECSACWPQIRRAAPGWQAYELRQVASK